MSDAHTSTVRALVDELVPFDHLMTHPRSRAPGGGEMPVGAQLRAQLTRRRQIISARGCAARGNAPR